MPHETFIRLPFNAFHITYAVTNPSGKDFAQIDFLDGAKKVGQALFGEAIVPGAFAALYGENEIHLFFPAGHFANLLNVLRSDKTLGLFVQLEERPPYNARWGGVIAD